MKINTQTILPKGGEIISAGALIQDVSGNFIFELRTDDCPHCPNGIEVFGGMIDDNEDALACLSRELLEELNFSYKDQELKPILLGYQESLADPLKWNARYLITGADTSKFIVSEESAGSVTFSSLEEAFRQAKHPLGFSVQGYRQLNS